MATTGGSAKKVGLFANPREDWLALRTEEMIDPGRAIIDAHHHLWEHGDRRYLLNDLSADLASGHNVIATVYVECHSMYRASGPEAFRPVGEVEFANGVAAMSATGAYGPAAVCAGIVGHVNLLLADSARPVLEADVAAGNGRFRGIRHVSAWDADKDIAGVLAKGRAGLLLDTDFRKGFACLAPLGLTFDAFLFQPQIDELTDLARAFPDTGIVLDHCGGPVTIGRFAGRREEAFQAWRVSIRELGKCPQYGGEAGRTRGPSAGDRVRGPADATDVRGSSGGMAPLHRNLHRGVRRRALHVREQLSAGQGAVQLPGDLQCVQTHHRRLQRCREDRHFLGDGGGLLPAPTGALGLPRHPPSPRRRRRVRCP